MFTFRITKYDPAARDVVGAYLRDEWTSWSDIGRTFAGVRLTESEYERVENAYVEVATEYLREARVQALAVTGLESQNRLQCPIAEGSIVNLESFGDILRDMLREKFWCRLESGVSFVHVGWDYYMYVGVPSVGPRARALAVRVGLFVEEFASPYAVASA